MGLLYLYLYLYLYRNNIPDEELILLFVIKYLAYIYIIIYMRQYVYIKVLVYSNVYGGQCMGWPAQKLSVFCANKMNAYFIAVMYLHCLLFIGSSKMQRLLECE
jgi:hypothetical protein